MYLRDTFALRKASRKVMDLISTLPADVIALSISMTDGTTDPDMNEYTNQMD
jgi:hypothetical protein